MDDMKQQRYGIRLLAVGVVVLLGGGSAQAWDDRLNPEKATGPEACIECHIDTGRVWEGTHHFTTFRSLPRSDRAREIADKMGIKRIKSESLCLSCHFSSQTQDTGKIKPIAGISCESCHGAGQDWLDIHSDYGGKAVTKESETPEHLAERLAKSEQAGMIRPARIASWAANCYSCHTVPQESLVNVGGHPAGSEFELVSWSQGEVRHNVWYSGGKENVESSAERKRVMYVTGQAMDLAHALYGVSKSTEKAEYSVAMAKRAKAAILRLQKIAEAVSIPEVGDILTVAEAAELKLNNEGPLTEAADKVLAGAKQFAENHDGSTLAAVDALIPSPDQYKGTPAP